MAVDVARAGEGGKEGVVARFGAWVRTLPSTYRAIMNEMRRVTWPSIEETRQLSVMVVVLSLFIGGVIAVMDVSFQAILVRWIPQLFAR
jgi:preprotein translocase SecE subunit